MVVVVQNPFGKVVVHDDGIRRDQVEAANIHDDQPEMEAVGHKWTGREEEDPNHNHPVDRHRVWVGGHEAVHHNRTGQEEEDRRHHGKDAAKSLDLRTRSEAVGMTNEAVVDHRQLHFHRTGAERHQCRARDDGEESKQPEEQVPW